MTTEAREKRGEMLKTKGDCPTCAAHGKPHFGWCSWKYLDNEPSVLGAGCGPAPMPIEEDRRRAWRNLYVAKFVAIGLDAETAQEWFDDLNWDDVKDEDPEAMADDEMEYWTDDE